MLNLIGLSSPPQRGKAGGKPSLMRVLPFSFSFFVLLAKRTSYRIWRKIYKSLLHFQQQKQEECNKKATDSKDPKDFSGSPRKPTTTSSSNSYIYYRQNPD